MSEAVVTPGPAVPAGEHPRRRLLRISASIVGTLVVVALLELAGIDVWGWLTSVWDTVKGISLGYVVVGCIFQGLQTTLTALGWYGILRFAYPGGVTFMAVLTAYAAGVALNNVVPANLGTFVTLLMSSPSSRGRRSRESSARTRSRRSSM